MLASLLMRMTYPVMAVVTGHLGKMLLISAKCVNIKQIHFFSRALCYFKHKQSRLLPYGCAAYALVFAGREAGMVKE